MSHVKRKDKSVDWSELILEGVIALVFVVGVCRSAWLIIGKIFDW